MKPFPQRTAALAGAALGFFSMAAIGWKLADRPTPVPKVVEEKPTKSAGRPTRQPRLSGPPEHVRQRMAALRAISSPAERMRATIEFANTLPVSEIEGWLEGRWFDTGGGFDLSLFNKILTERWAIEDREGLVLWSIKNGGHNGQGPDSIIASWAKDEPQRVIEFFREHPNYELQIEALTTIAKDNPALALRGLQEMASSGALVGNPQEYYNRQLFQELAKSSPATLEAALDGLPPALKHQAETALIGQKLTTSFDTEFQKLLDRPDGLKIFQNLSDTDGLGDKLLGNLANLPPAWKASILSNCYQLIDSSNSQKWWDADLEGMGFTPAQANQAHSYALSVISRKQPEEALKLMDEVGLNHDRKENLLSTIFSRVSGNPEKSEALLAMLTSDEDRKTAQQVLDRNNETASITLLEKPADWLAKVGSMDANPGDAYEYLSMLRNWDQEKISALGDQFRSMPAAQKQQAAQILTDANSDLAPSLKGEALRYLLTNPVTPPAGQETGASNKAIRETSELAVNWSKSDPAAASAWVQNLPAGDARIWAQKNLAASWTQYDPKATAQWMKSLPENERAEVRKFIENENHP